MEHLHPRGWQGAGGHADMGGVREGVYSEGTANLETDFIFVFFLSNYKSNISML